MKDDSRDRCKNAFEIAEKKAFRTTALFDRIAEDGVSPNQICFLIGLSPVQRGSARIIKPGFFSGTMDSLRSKPFDAGNAARYRL